MSLPVTDTKRDAAPRRARTERRTDGLDPKSLHALRNAMSTACLALDVGLMLLEQHQTERALAYFKDAREACEACCPLLLGETAAPEEKHR